MWMLIAIAGPDKGQAHPLDPDATRDRPMVLGREGDPFRSSDRRVSRRHAGLFRENGKWCVDDLGSSTGTLRNHKPVVGTQTLREGDFLQVGKTVLTLSRMESTAEAVPANPPKAMGPAASALGTSPLPANPRSRGTAGWLLGVGSAAAVVLIGLGVFNQQQAARLADERRLADAEAEARVAERVAALEASVLARLDAEVERDADLSASVAAIPPAQAAAAEELARVRSAVDAGRAAAANDFAALTDSAATQTRASERLAAGLEGREERLVASLADATADRLRPDLAPLPGDLVEEVRAVGDRIAALPEALAPKLDAVAEAVVADRRTGQEQLLAALPDRAAFDDRMASVEARLDRLPDAAALDARLAAVTEALRQQPVDPAEADRFATLRDALASIAADLKDRPDAAALRAQLEDVAAMRPVEPDPILAQVLAGLTAQRAASQRLEAGLARVAEAGGGFDADALAARVVAALPEPAKAAAVTGEPATAATLDGDALAAAVESALAGTALADADSLRTLVRGEVSLALRGSTEEEADARQIDRRSLERAYRSAFETGRKRVLPGGRVLDPAAARAAGVESWRDWYLIDEFAERMRLAREASRIRGTLADPTVITLPSR